MQLLTKQATIKDLGKGWYSFRDINQEGRYIQIHALYFNDGKKETAQQKAVRRARKILNDKQAVITIQ